jgi:hypothetical protein
MKKVLKYSSLTAVWAFVYFRVWMTILSAYYLIAGPETFTKFELYMSALASCFLADKIISIFFTVQDKCTDKTEGANDIFPLDKMIEMYEKEFNSDSYLVRQNIAYLKELKHRRVCDDLKEGAEE